MDLKQRQDRKWTKLSLTTVPDLEDALTDFLIGVTNASVEITLEDEAKTITLNAFLAIEAEADITVEIQQIESFCRELSQIYKVELPTIKRSSVQEEDWSNSWKKHFTPFAIIPGLVIVPSWEEYQPLENEEILVMDPGMAFGTGQHPTTHLCLVLMEKILAEYPNIPALDVGTGTGILAMAAARLGQSKVTAIDNDPDAVDAAIVNAGINLLQDSITVSDTPLAQLSGPYSLIIANIIHDVLVEMAADLARLSPANGRLVLSGLIKGSQGDSIQQIFQQYGFSLIEQKNEGEWTAIHLQKQ